MAKDGILALLKKRGSHRVGVDGWQTWGGGECPVPPSTQVLFRMKADSTSRNKNPHGPNPAHDLRWLYTKTPSDIVAYKVVT